MASFCSECGAVVASNARFCEECGTPVEEHVTTTVSSREEQLTQTPPSARTLRDEQSSRSSPATDMEIQRHVVVVGETKSSGVGIVLSFLWTGLGQLYAGSILRGLVLMGFTPLVWMVGWFGGLAAFFGGVGTLAAKTASESATASSVGFFGFLMAILPGIWWLWGMVDAKNLCEAFNRRVARTL